MGYQGKLMRNFLLGLLCLSLSACCWFNPKECEDCFEEPNLWFPETVTNVEITRTSIPTWVGQVFYPAGTTVGVFQNVFVINEFFSVKRTDSATNREFIFFWNANTPPAFDRLFEGEKITFYKTVVNLKPDLANECLFTTAEEVKSVLDVKVRRGEGGTPIGQRSVEKTVLSIPAGQYATFSFEFEFLACGNYEFDIQIDPDGKLAETSINDNNFSETKTNFGFCF